MARDLVRIRNVCPKCGAQRFLLHKNYGDTLEEWNAYVKRQKEKEPTRYACDRCTKVPTYDDE